MILWFSRKRAGKSQQGAIDRSSATNDALNGALSVLKHSIEANKKTVAKALRNE